MTKRPLTEDDVGKRVVDTTGDKIGTIESVREGQAYVEPDTDVDDPLLSKLGWSHDEEEPYPLDEADIEEVGEGEILVRRH